MKTATASIAATASFLLALAPALAATPPPPPPAAAAPAVRAPVAGDEGIEPEVTIIHRRGRTIEEYRVNGRVYMIKITPRKGIPYYLVDTDGDGNLDTERTEIGPHLLIPSWVILRW